MSERGRRLRVLLLWAAIVCPLVPLVAALFVGGWPSRRFLGLYVTPLFVIGPLWLRERLRERPLRAGLPWAIDLTVFALAVLRFATGNVLPFSGHMLFLTYTLIVTRAAWYRALALAIALETAWFKLLLWHDWRSFTLGIAGGALAAVMLLATACAGPPARLVAGSSDTLVVNNERPARLPVRVLDARGHVLPDSGLRFARTAGDAILVSPSGEVTCPRPGDAVVRASIGAARRDFHVLCRPLHRLDAAGAVRLVLGDSAQFLPIYASGADNRPVTQLAATLKIMDSTIATLDGLRVRARAPGETRVGVWAGERFTWVGVLVFGRATSPEGIRPGQNLALPVRLASGETRRWRLPAGRYRLSMLPDVPDTARPRLATEDAGCMRLSWGGELFCESTGQGTVIVYVPWRATPSAPLSGQLAIQRLADAAPEP